GRDDPLDVVDRVGRPVVAHGSSRLGEPGERRGGRCVGGFWAQAGGAGGGTARACVTSTSSGSRRSAALDLDVTDLELGRLGKLCAPDEYVLPARVLKAERVHGREVVTVGSHFAPSRERVPRLVGDVDLATPAVLERGHDDGGDVVRRIESHPEADAGFGVAEAPICVALGLPRRAGVAVDREAGFVAVLAPVPGRRVEVVRSDDG